MFEITRVYSITPDGIGVCEMATDFNRVGRTKTIPINQDLPNKIKRTTFNKNSLRAKMDVDDKVYIFERKEWILSKITSCTISLIHCEENYFERRKHTRHRFGPFVIPTNSAHFRDSILLRTYQCHHTETAIPDETEMQDSDKDSGIISSPPARHITLIPDNVFGNGCYVMHLECLRHRHALVQTGAAGLQGFVCVLVGRLGAAGLRYCLFSDEISDEICDEIFDGLLTIPMCRPMLNSFLLRRFDRWMICDTYRLCFLKSVILLLVIFVCDLATIVFFEIYSFSSSDGLSCGDFCLRSWMQIVDEPHMFFFVHPVLTIPRLLACFALIPAQKQQPKQAFRGL